MQWHSTAWNHQGQKLNCSGKIQNVEIPGAHHSMYSTKSHIEKQISPPSYLTSPGTLRQSRLGTATGLPDTPHHHHLGDSRCPASGILTFHLLPDSPPNSLRHFLTSVPPLPNNSLINILCGWPGSYKPYFLILAFIIYTAFNLASLGTTSN